MSVLRGTVGDDELHVLVGHDRVYSYEGNDTIYGGTGAAQIVSGAGNDWIISIAGDVVLAGDGDDRISAYSATSGVKFYGGVGNDFLEGSSSADTLYGGTGNDTFYDSGPDDLIYGGAGIDTLQVSFLSFTVVGPSIVYTFTPGGSLSAPLSTPNGSVYYSVEQIDITGSAWHDQLTGGWRNDTLRGWHGNDILQGRGGDDILIGDNGDDQLFGDYGNDQIQSGSGNDTLYGGSGNDLLLGTHAGSVYSGNTIFIGGTGADTINARFSSSTTLSFRSSTEAVYVDLSLGRGFGGDAQGDTYIGGFGEIWLTDGNDMLVGGARQYGFSGDDILVQSNGTRTMAGGAGTDSFVMTVHLSAIFENLTISDFDTAEGELIDLRRVDARPAAGDQAFVFIGQDTFTGGRGEVRFQYDTDTDRTRIELDMVGSDGAADYWFYLNGQVNLDADHFLF
ncbi:calcium-binding protein [Paracoccus sp. KR1-242]|uniref:calcium-binding protein n=1 Tax=Paracoccus sp. KR1-242 TaxID=3410028 RepID=UPI003C021CAD